MPLDGWRLRSGDERPVADSVRGQDESLPTLKALNCAELPDVPNGHWRPAGEAASEIAGTRLRDRDAVFDICDELEENTLKALRAQSEILDLPLDGYETVKEQVQIGNLKQSAARTILNTQVRVDEQRFRRQQADIMPKILETLEREKLRLANMSL